MTNLTHAAAKVIQLNHGRLVGKTRLQKSLYFLEELEAGFGLTFDYYHYGPYSEELSIATDDAVALHLINVDWKSTNAGTQYAIYTSILDQEAEGIDERRKAILSVLSNYDAVTVEIAATADYLSKNGFEENSWEETGRRKPEKTTADRTSKARKLLTELYDIPR